MKEKNISAVVLAGGRSSRMGQNKALLKLGEKNMIERIVDKLRPILEEIILVTDYPEEYPMLKDVVFVKDEIMSEEKNSLVGIYSGLLASKNKHVFVVPCDMPFLNQELIKYMINELKEEDLLIPYIKGYYQPLHAIYGKKCIKPIRGLLEKKQYKIINFFQDVNIKTVDEKVIMRFSRDMRCFLNINTYDTYSSIQENWK